MYHYDTVDNYWTVDTDNPLTTGATLEVRVSHQENNVWATEYLDGSTWVQVGINNMGYSTAQRLENVLEILAYDSTHPSLPQVDVDNGKLCANGDWSTWNTYYTTSTWYDPPYEAHYNTQYYNFYVHKH